MFARVGTKRFIYTVVNATPSLPFPRGLASISSIYSPLPTTVIRIEEFSPQAELLSAPVRVKVLLASEGLNSSIATPKA